MDEERAQSTDVQGSPPLCVLTGARLAHDSSLVLEQVDLIAASGRHPERGKTSEGVRTLEVRVDHCDGLDHDYQGRTAIRGNYLRLAEMMLSPAAKISGLYPIFATHDEALARRISALARTSGWLPNEFEFEMLYGVRSRWQQQLRSDGDAVRVYLPFGNDWWAYAIRRLGENPRNLLLLGRTLLRR